MLQTTSTERRAAGGDRPRSGGGVKKFSVRVTEILLADNAGSFCVNRRARVNARINEAFCPTCRRETAFILLLNLVVSFLFGCVAIASLMKF